MSFHVPNHRRARAGPLASLDEDGNNGAFTIPSPFDSRTMVVIASDGGGWEHVSVSRSDRIPSWKEMCEVKGVFWDKEDWVVQFHPPESEYVNNHRFCLHLWRPTVDKMPTPPSWMVGEKGVRII